MAQLIIVTSSVLGFGIALYIFTRSNKRGPLVCPIGGHCDFVTQSRYAKTFGIPNTLLGMGYYAAMAVLYGISATSLAILSAEVIFLVRVATAGAFGFSLYLILVQAFLLRQWCSWCLMSAALSTIIFVFVFFV
jgi:uncharacterized membrane protein